MSLIVSADLSNAKVRTGGMQDMEPGVYVGKTTGVEAYNNGKSFKFSVDCGEAGETEIYLGADFTKDGNKNGLVTALVSHGKNAEKIRAAGAKFQFDLETLVGQKCFIIVRKVEGQDDQGRPKLNDKSFLPPDRYEAMKNMKPRAVPAANGAATPAAQAPAQPAGTPSAALFD